jgi:hypothetical protein
MVWLPKAPRSVTFEWRHLPRFESRIAVVLLVVFGAGSSYDSVPHLPAPLPSHVERLWEDRPPLANQLFDTRTIFVELMEQFKDCQPLVPLLRQPGISIEKKLAEFREQSSTFPQAQRELNAIRFYLHFALWDCQDRWRTRHKGITNFATLLREVERWRFEKKEQVCFVTFNYDTMLEEAMSHFLRLHVGTMDSYITLPDYALFKLHGSINWGLEVDSIAHPGNNVPYPYQNLIQIVTPGSHFLTKKYRKCDRVMSSAADRVVLFPALSIPVEKKDEFSCPAEHITALEGLLPRVTKIITIGWRATEAEFLRMLKFSRQMPYAGIRNAMSLLIVTGTEKGAEETLKNLIEVGGSSPELFERRIPVTTGFTGLINDLERLRVFLRS